jgi:TrmH family RNA methyltransferase
VITSASNPRLKLVRRLQTRRGRDRLGLFVCEGEDIVAAALEAGLEPVEALVDADRPALAERLPGAEQVAPRLLASLSELPHPGRVIAVFRRADLPRFDAPDPPAAGLALWHVADPANVGALLRSADALGPAFLCLSDGCADHASPKALRASVGATFRVPVGRFEEAPHPRVALIPRGGVPLPEVGLPELVTFVLGGEREGLPSDVAAACEVVASIPQTDAAESLNVAAAGAIALYERRRRAAGVQR